MGTASQSLRKVLEQAEADGVAVGHFNVSDLVILKAVFQAARDKSVPVVVGASEGERQFAGDEQLSALVKSLRDEFDFPIFLNADHTHSLQSAVKAAKAGFDWIVFDLSALPFEENIRQTKAAVEKLKGLRPDILIEGEIGDIGSGSEIHDAAPDLRKGLTTPEQARQFLQETRVDTLAPAVGNMHGMLKTMVAGNAKKRLDIERIRAVKAAAPVFLTLHGGSGTDDADFREAIEAGITVVHINTEVRLAWRRGFDAALAAHPDEIVPYKLLPGVVDSIQQVVSSRLALFNEPRRARSASQ
ncbi:MAG TPA: class II fructose-bisphosphate aldolase [Candidatus Baltobacteraceae bacterium]|nr:class II fructose-bisphosphate aldolase [Candidatus Baltobacteraceae bacterium]